MGLRFGQETLEIVNTGFKSKSNVSTTGSSWLLLCSNPKYSNEEVVPGVLQTWDRCLQAAKGAESGALFLQLCPPKSLPLGWRCYCQQESYDGLAPQTCLAHLCLQWQPLPMLQNFVCAFQTCELFLACSELICPSKVSAYSSLFRPSALPNS